MKRRLVLLCLMVLSGCVQSGPARQQSSAAGSQSSKALEQLTLGTKLLQEQKYNDAEKHLLQALSFDAFSGLAHNNLGSVYYAQGRLYDAAREFQDAIKLLPQRPEPRNNLGLVLEAGGKLDEAIVQYQQAMELQPDNPMLLGNLVRAHVRRGDRNAQTRQLLMDLLAKETRSPWREWARKELAMHY
jgi:Tfp pilus assembly protein PilF